MSNNITITRAKNTVSAPFMPYTAYKAAIALAETLKGEIGKTAEGNFKATFSSAKTAEKFVKDWTASYNANRKVEAAPKQAPAKKPTASKKAPRKAKGSAFDFGSIKGDTKSDKNKALHAVLVSMGMKDSRTAEYQAIWNARPWAK